MSTDAQPIRSTGARKIPDGPMSGHRVLLTDGTSDIAKATALGLARLGARVSIVGADLRRTEAVADEIRAVGRRRVGVFIADLSSLPQVRRLAEEVHERLPRIDVLVNTAGGYWNTRHVTADGLERTFAVNHLAPFLLTNLLLDRLTRSAPARVVIVSHRTQTAGQIDFDDLQEEHDYSGARAYGQSKLANVLFTYELARRAPDTLVTFNAVQAGVVGTADRGPAQRLLAPLLRPFMKRPDRDAVTSIHVASAPELERVTGRDFDNRRSAALSCDEVAATRLWQVSADLVGLTAPTKPR